MIDIEALCKRGIAEWTQMKQIADISPWQIDDEKKDQHERQLDQLWEDVLPFFDHFPKQAWARAAWKKQGQAYFEQLTSRDDILLMEDMDEESRTLFQRITISFLKDVRQFDRSLSVADAMQALRNVWIIAILQRIFDKSVGYHPAMFAYSMLYPYSDNYLDDVQISYEEKKSFNRWFSKRLRGEVTCGRNAREEQISALVSMIEQQFDRHRYPMVYESLYLIQDAQIISLQQQDGERPLRKEELTKISYQKGGTSVVADGALIDGTLSEEQMMFCMRYGFMLQLGDDLQDGVEDERNHHQTLFSVSLSESVDDLLKKLIQYTIDILRPQSICQNAALLQFVLKDCLFLLFLAVGQNEVPISDSLRTELLACLPVHPEYGEAKQKAFTFSYTDEELWERIDTLLF